MMPEKDTDRLMQKSERQEQTIKVNTHLPLPALLSHILVAFTIELDNEFEHQVPHRTTNDGATPGSCHAPWLVSLVMWFNCMQFISEEGVTVSALHFLARTETNLDGMRRWGYIVIEPDAEDRRSKQPRPDAVLRPTRAGRNAQTVWPSLVGLIEERWRERFGREELDQLREVLWAVVRQFDLNLPDCLPILRYGLFNQDHHSGEDRLLRMQDKQKQRSHGVGEEDHVPPLPLYVLLSRVLLAFALEFEHESDLSLAISANVVRVLSEQGVFVRDLPHLSGVSKEAISMAMSILQKEHVAVIEPDLTGRRLKIVRLTSHGQKAQERSHQLMGTIEERWQSCFGRENVHALRESMEHLVSISMNHQSPLWKGLEPYPEGWRALIRKPDTLPYYPMVLHRGGFPDGS